MHVNENMFLLQMVPSKGCEERILFNDLSNAINLNDTGKLMFKSTFLVQCNYIYAFILGGITNITVGEAITSDDIPTLEDFGQRRRQRDRKRYAQMCVQQKEKLLKKRRENYQQKKTATTYIGAEHKHLLGTVQVLLIYF